MLALRADVFVQNLGIATDVLWRVRGVVHLAFIFTYKGIVLDKV